MHVYSTTAVLAHLLNCRDCGRCRQR